MAFSYEALFPYLLGVFLAVAVAYPASSMEPARERRFFTGIMAVVILGFFGFPLSQGAATGLAWELAAVAVLGALLALTLRRVELLPAVWIAHGIWDFAFLVGATPIDKPVWLCALCVPFDWLIGAYLVSRLGRWRAAGA